MNCRDVTPLLSAERDGPLDGAVREALERHVAACPACRRTRADLAEAAGAWRAGTARAATPDPAGEWRTLRAQLRAGTAGSALGGGTGPSFAPSPRRSVSPWWVTAGTLPFAAAAVWLAMLALEPGKPVPAGESGTVIALAPSLADVFPPARADYVEAPAESSPVIFLDQESGWLIVWAEAPAAHTSG
jgi:anti-sigma factor RsiW